MSDKGQIQIDISIKMTKQPKRPTDRPDNKGRLPNAAIFANKQKQEIAMNSEKQIPDARSSV